MQLKSKSLSGVVQPLSYVDSMLRQQGFTRSAGKSSPAYDVVIFDSSTSTSYFLRIPTRYQIPFSSNGELKVRFGQPYLEAKEKLKALSRQVTFIPTPVRQAAEHKLAEIADYLQSPPKES